MRPKLELYPLDHCCRQHVRRRPTADDGRARCLVMGTPLSIGVTGVDLFSPSPVKTPRQQLGMTPRRAAPTPRPPPLMRPQVSAYPLHLIPRLVLGDGEDKRVHMSTSP